jgi:hypothetical protein
MSAPEGIQMLSLTYESSANAQPGFKQDHFSALFTKKACSARDRRKYRSLEFVIKGTN